MKQKIKWKHVNGDGWQYSDDNGATWYRTMRTDAEVQRMCKNGYGVIDDVPILPEPEDELEIFGDTLDEPIPDDFAEYILALT